MLTMNYGQVGDSSAAAATTTFFQFLEKLPPNFRHMSFTILSFAIFTDFHFHFDILNRLILVCVFKCSWLQIGRDT